MLHGHMLGATIMRHTFDKSREKLRRGTKMLTRAEGISCRHEDLSNLSCADDAENGRCPGGEVYQFDPFPRD